MKKIRVFFVYLLAFSMLAGGCGHTKRQAVVMEKDIDNMLELAKDTSDYTEVKDLAKDYSIYSTSIEDKDFGVTVNVDVNVKVPDTDKLSVFRVEQEEISQDMLDRLIELTVGDGQLYEGAVLEQSTKAEIEMRIARYKAEMEAMSECGDYAAANDYQANIDELQADYESAPDQISFEGWETDGSIKSVKELLGTHPNSKYYEWQSECNDDGDVFFGVTDGRSGEYISIYAQNNENYGNCIRYSKNSQFWEYNSAMDAGEYRQRYEVGTDIGEMIELQGSSYFGAVEIDKTDKISKQEAKSLADSFIHDMGLMDFVCSDIGYYSVVLDERYSERAEKEIANYYRNVYELTYLRSVDGVLVTDQKTKRSESNKGGNYIKKSWAHESIIITVNGDGIVGFSYNSPMKITETVVEKASVKPFDDVRDTFEQMIVIANATLYDKVNIDIDRIELVYARISEPDSFDTGLLVPIWDFRGQDYVFRMEHMGAFDTSFLSINAIDGSVIDWELGY